MKRGAFDFIEKPFAIDAIVQRVRHVIIAWRQLRVAGYGDASLTRSLGVDPLTLRETEVLSEIVRASSNKEAALHLGISPRTIEVHRARINSKLGAKNTADLVRIALADRRC
jgi:two-component system, LuxR family, response regulator FixJ